MDGIASDCERYEKIGSDVNVDINEDSDEVVYKGRDNDEEDEDDIGSMKI